MNKKNIKLNQDLNELKNDLKKIGRGFDFEAKGSQLKLENKLSEIYNNTSNEKLKKSAWKWSWLLLPVGGLALFILVVNFNNQHLIQTTAPQFDYSLQKSVNNSEFNVADMQESAMEAPQYKVGVGRYQTKLQTFKDKFIDELGQHEASPEDIINKGVMLEKDLNVHLITTEKQPDVELFARNTFESFGGYLENFNQTNSSRTLYIQGKIPADKLYELRLKLKDYVGEDKYYSENLSAVSRTSDVIVIDEKVKEVEDSIKLLEDRIAKETDLKQKVQWEKQLKEHIAYLAEREQTKKIITDRIDYADVSLNVQLINKFWQARNIRDIEKLYNGFEQISLWDKMIVNILRVIIIFFKILSVTFWLIPFVVWYIVHKKRENELLKELD